MLVWVVECCLGNVHKIQRCGSFVWCRFPVQAEVYLYTVRKAMLVSELL